MACRQRQGRRRRRRRPPRPGQHPWQQRLGRRQGQLVCQLVCQHTRRGGQRLGPRARRRRSASAAAGGCCVCSPACCRHGPGWSLPAAPGTVGAPLAPPLCQLPACLADLLTCPACLPARLLCPARSAPADPARAQGGERPGGGAGGGDAPAGGLLFRHRAQEPAGGVGSLGGVGWGGCRVGGGMWTCWPGGVSDHVEETGCCVHCIGGEGRSLAGPLALIGTLGRGSAAPRSHGIPLSSLAPPRAPPSAPPMHPRLPRARACRTLCPRR